MKKSRFTESQIVSILKQANSGMKIDEICRQNGICNATYYNWKSKYGGMEATYIKRLKELNYEHNKLNRLFAEVSMENYAMEFFAKRACDNRE